MSAKYTINAQDSACYIEQQKNTGWKKPVQKIVRKVEDILDHAVWVKKKCLIAAQ